MRGFKDVPGLAAAATLWLWVGTVSCTAQEPSVEAAPPTDELQMGETEIEIDEVAPEQAGEQP
jgi:hypothetical protein